MIFLSQFSSKRILIATCALALSASCIHKKYENPITKNTQQPDKILFDQAVKDIEHGRYEVARLSLQTLMNTYESSEYMAKAKLAVADSWYREGGGNGMAQAEAEYKDFELFYPQMEEAAEAQNRICEIHYKQMDKSDRDDTQALRAQDECRQLIVQFPNSKFVPKAQQMLRNIQESLAEHEFVVGNFYWKRDMNPAAANRLDALVDQYPLYSKADEALFEAGDAYMKMGPRFRKAAGDDFARIVQNYPLGSRTSDAKERLQDMEMPVPNVDPNSMARMKFEEENYKGPGMLARSTGLLHSGPDVSHAAKEGSPTMTDPKKTIPKSVPIPVPEGTETAQSTGGTATGTTDVTATTVGSDNSALDKNPDARTTSDTAAAATPATNQATASTAPLPSNRQRELERMQKERAKKQAQLEKKAKKKIKSDQSNTDTSAPAASSSPVNTNSTGNELSSPGAASAGTQGQTTPSSTAPVPAPQQQ
jgi:outer membrane protein assembly factor BamD